MAWLINMETDGLMMNWTFHFVTMMELFPNARANDYDFIM
jgi:hypothetical protein